jgi:hypothetical protein
MKTTSLTLLFALLISASLHAQDAGTTPTDSGSTPPAPTTDAPSAPAPTEPADPTGEVKTKAPKADLVDLAKKVEDKYSITPDRMAQLESDGLKLKDIVTAAEIAKESGKTLDDVLAMRKDKKGWGAIAKELNVSPDRIGQAMAELRRSDKAEKKDNKDNKDNKDKKDKKDKKERKEDREEKGDRKDDRDEKREERREDKKEKRDDRREERKERREDRQERREDRQERREDRKDDTRENRHK